MKEGPTYQYSAEDIQRYLDGKMDQAGMHALEKAALEDPFLADAIDGFRDMRPNIKEDIMEMQNKLSEKKQEERKRRWIPIAIALLLLLSFGGWLIFREDGGQQQIARQEGAQQSTQDPNQTMPDSSSIGAVEDKSADDKIGSPSAATKDLASSKPDNTKAEESKPAEVASSKATKTATATDPAISADAGAAPSVASVDAAGRKASESAKKTLTAPSKAEAELAKTAAPTARAKGAYQFETLEMAKNVEPVTGWTAFAKYIQSNMQRPEGGMHGTVGTNFVVAPDGSISDITVVKSLHPDYDKEAVRLLQNGPKWKASNGGDKAVKAVYNVVF